MKFITKTREETISLGEKLGKLLPANSILAMNGDLAAGKTTFTKGIGIGLGIKQVINSPTFNILKIYEGSKTLYHIDAYRLEENPYDLGFEEYMDDDGIMVIEWFDYMKDMISNDYLELKFKYIDDETREIEFIPHGSKYDDVLKELEVC
jgi:tRNA threonylcarbamoyladenosine biosynthesis protein TsaE